MKKDGEKLYLVDGMASIFRAYFGLPPMTNRSGFPTNAIYGFHGMLKKLLQEEQPDYLGVAFDLPGPTFRHREYSDRLEKQGENWRFTERRELVGQTGDLSAHLLQSFDGPTGD